MANPHGVIPADMWVCCKCGGPNLIATAAAACPVCNHYRDSTCSGPGEPIPNNCAWTPDATFHQGQSANPGSGYYSVHNGYADAYQSFSTHEEHPPSYTDYSTGMPTDGQYSYSTPGDVWICNECEAVNQTWYDKCPICDKGTKP
ncbi:hypothetical protein IQ07DRAFT_605527 [Pyrenochaeta sp. DS3sAY3a]|nr:hypothetical protein IQ07DRAFT_605527 [Pyrenochaeta sp. DS3sAY3a]